MFYTNHKKIHIGDIVYLQTERLNGKIKDIISTHEKKIEWGLDDFGIMIECDVFGLLFLSEDLLSTVILCSSQPAIEFKCVGYDIRYRNLSVITADLMMWDRDDDFYSNIIEQLGLSRNIFQLLNLSEDDFIALSDIVKQRSNLCLVSIHIPHDIYELYLHDDKCLGNIYVSSQKSVESYDICDIDGFFSFFDMQKMIKKLTFDDMDLIQKLSLVQFANFKIREHSPFCLVKIMTV